MDKFRKDVIVGLLMMGLMILGSVFIYFVHISEEEKDAEREEAGRLCPIECEEKGFEFMEIDYTFGKNRCYCYDNERKLDVRIW